MQKLVWQNSNGDVIDLTSGNYGITNWEGFSNTELNIQSQQVPFQDGAVFLDALMEQRELSVTLAINDGGSLETRYRLRRELIHALNPKLGEGYLIYTNDFISKRIKCVAQIPLFETHNSNDSGTPKASLAWTACEPYWEDLEDITLEISLDETVRIENNGDKDVGFTLDFFQTDGVANPKLTSITENKIIKYNGLLEKNLKISTETGKKDAITEELNFNVLAQNVNLFSVCKGRGLILAGGSAGILLTSEDSAIWKSQNSGVASVINSMAYSKTQGKYLLATNVISTSSDGSNWKNTGVSATYLYYDDETGYTFAIDSLTIKRSFDCENWDVVYTLPEEMTFSIGNNLTRDLNGLYNLTDNYTLTSTDGENWILTGTSGGTNRSIKKVIYKNGKYIAVGSTHIITSTDGITYTDQSFTGYDFRDIIYWNEIESYVVLSRTTGLMISSDGDTWSVSTNATGYCMFVNDDNFLLIFKNVIDKYTDLTNYTRIHSLIEHIYASCEGIKSELLLSASLSGIIYKVDNEGQISSVYESTDAPRCLIKIKDYVLGCGNNVLLKTTDETNWISKTTTNVFLNCIAYNEQNNVIVVVGTNGAVLRSVDDGETWTSQTLGVSNTLYSICYSKKHNKFIIVGYNLIADSSDGITWNLNTNPPVSFNKITCADDMDVLIASANINGAGVIYRSTDILNWFIAETLPENITIGDLSYISEYGYFFAVGYFGSIYISSNGLVWVMAFNFQENNELNSVVFSSKEDKLKFSGTFFADCTQKDLESVINKISSDSDLGMTLKTGINELFITADSGTFNARIKFRQKYIGV